MLLAQSAMSITVMSRFDSHFDPNAAERIVKSVLSISVITLMELKNRLFSSFSNSKIESNVSIIVGNGSLDGSLIIFTVEQLPSAGY